MFGSKTVKEAACAVLLMSATLLSLHAGTRAQGAPTPTSPQTQATRPPGGPLAPDLPIAKGHNDAAKALAEIDGNYSINWAYRIWCVTGYRTTGEAGTGQQIDALVDPDNDLMTPKGFIFTNKSKPMPSGGIQFMDNAWYFGTDLTGMVIVKVPEGLLMFDALSNPQDMQTQVVDEMKKVGLDPRDTKFIFMGHQHGDHVGGANLIRREYAPGAKFVMGQPDAEGIAQARARIIGGEAARGGGAGRGAAAGAGAAGRGAATGAGAGRGGAPAAPQTPEAAAAQMASRLFALPDSVEIQIPAFPGMTNGMQRIKIGDKTEVVAALVPGHTVGQMAVIVPVTYQGQAHKLVVWSGNDNMRNAVQYATSLEFFRSIAYIDGADAYINTHGYQGDAFKLLRQFKANPRMTNPFILGKDGVQRYVGIMAECHQAQAQRLLDGTWKSL